VDYESINVHGNAAGMEELRKLGARSVPIVARGRVRFCADADRRHQVSEPGRSPAGAPGPEALVGEIRIVLPAAGRYLQQIPAEWLDKPFRNRNRPIRALGHHVFRIVEAFLEAVGEGHELTYELIMREAAPALRSGEDLARYGADVLARADAWWAGCADRSGEGMMDTYFGRHPMQVVLERTAWHPAQHTRQLMLILDTLGIEPDRRLTAADLAGLPLPDKAWDDESTSV
jgi:hypothetical protein